MVGELEVIPPDPQLNNVSGQIRIGGEEEVMFSVKNFLYRGSVLKNTVWIIGVVAYTGKQTKIMMNSEEGKNKDTKVQRTTNLIILVIFSF